MSGDQQRVLSAGTARIDITPDPAMVNWVTGRPYNGIIDRLAARVLVVDDQETQLAFVAWDLIDSGEEAVANTRAAIHEATGIAPDHVVVSATHTHSGPRAPFSDAKRNLLMYGRPERVQVMRRVMEDSTFQTWGEALPQAIAHAAKEAQTKKVPVTLAIGRADVGEWLFNRRPIAPDGSCVTTMVPKNAKALPDGLRFGPLDPTLTALFFVGEGDQVVATLYNLPCHPVSVYPHHEGISADWPGPASDHISEALGGEALFLPGCFGDIVPVRRGLDARDEMARFFADRALQAAALRDPLKGGALRCLRYTVWAPFEPHHREAMGTDSWPLEMQAIACGSVAIVTMPGEPLSGLAREIQRRSPFAHTIVAGYTNGWGVSYVGLPGEKARGGYEATAGRGTDETGLLLIETGVRLLNELYQGKEQA